MRLSSYIAQVFKDTGWACQGPVSMLAALLLMLSPGLALAEWHNQDVALMGTRISVRLWHEDETTAARALAAAISEIERIERLMSTYIGGSVISAINRHAGTKPVQAGEELFSLIHRSIEISELTSGAFDITYESVGQHYDFRNRLRPDDTALAKSVALIDYRLVELDEARHTVRFATDGVRINLGGIAKGYAVERAAQVLRDCGIDSGMVTAGGDTRLIGERRGAPWIVGVQNPRDESQLAVRLPLSDEAISTSGDYERFFVEDGQRYHHIIAPRTGVPAAGLRSATVIGPDAVMTDALSTAVFILGVTDGIRLIESLPNYEAVVIDSAQKTHFSLGLAAPD